MLSKRFKFFICSVLSALGFLLLISLPYESHYFGLAAGSVLMSFLFWFGLGIVFDGAISTRLMVAILPVSLFLGWGLFVALLPLTVWLRIIISLIFGIICYVIFLVDNVFMVAIGYRTVPLYRAAYTVSLIITLLASFFLFNSIYSFRLPFWANTILIFLASLLIFNYQFWAIAIELPDDGKGKSRVVYSLIPALLVGELALVFSFWPVGIFKGSIYLVSVLYILLGLLQSDIRDRLFRRTWLTFSWIGIAIILGILSITRWG